MAKLDICANFFANYLWYGGDPHYEQTAGPERANRLEPCATAKREGVHFSIHSDANVTPISQLRVTPSGRVLGEHERFGAYDAMVAVTVDAAYQMHLDHVIGSIEAGKLVDFTVLEANPLTVDPMTIKGIPIWGHGARRREARGTESRVERSFSSGASPMRHVSGYGLGRNRRFLPALARPGHGAGAAALHLQRRRRWPKRG